MADQMNPQDQMQPQDAQAAPQGGDQPDALETVKKLEEALNSLKEALAGANAPAEVMDPLSAAVQSFGEFVSVMTGTAAPSKGGAIQSDQMAKGAVPVDQYTGKGMKAVRA